MKNKNIVKFSIVAIILVTLFWAFQKYDLGQYFTEDYIRNTVDSFGVFGPLVFMGLYYSAVLLFISAAAFTILSGLLFGKLYGSIYVVIAATLAAQTGFMISKKLGEEFVEKKIKNKTIQNFIGTVNEKLKETGGFKTFFILRCLFLPYMPLSYAAGLVKEAKAKDFFFATLITNMIFSPAFVYFGESLTKGPQALILPAVLIVLVLLVPKILKKIKSLR